MIQQTVMALATGNRHKAEEIRSLLEGIPVRWLSLRELYLGTGSGAEEDGATLEENARKKAAWVAQRTGLWALADDTGLEVEALGGAPGVRSARYAGEEASYEQNNKKILRELGGLGPEERKAVFRCVVALAEPDGRVLVEEGFLRGLIAERPAGDNGFGYDALFLLPSLNKTLAQLKPREKNRISHRAQAIRKMVPHLKSLLKERSGPRPFVCPICERSLEERHCRLLCRECGYQEDCSDVGLG